MNGPGDAGRSDAALLAALSPVLELAVIVAQTGERATPPIAAPLPLRPFLQFTKRIPAPALRAARRILDDDPEFRSRVSAIATEALVGRAGVLFAARPDGWEAELVDVTLESGEDESGERGARPDRKLERRLAGAEASVRRAEAALAKQRADLGASQSVLASERSARHALDEALDESRARNDLLDAALQQSRTEVDRLREELRSTQIALAAVQADRERLKAAEARREQLDAAIDRALDAVGAVGAAFETLRAATVTEIEIVPVTSAGRARTPSRIERAQAARPGGRRPTALPPAIFDDGPEAAHFLLRVAGVVVLIDGYNVSKWKWTALSAAEQRRRLCDVLEQLAARTGAELHVVFDGSDDDLLNEPAVAQGGGSRARTVRVSFSPPQVDADDVILELIGSVPQSRAVVVVSSDRRVRTGASQRGANVISSQQFVSAWGSPGAFVTPPR